MGKYMKKSKISGSIAVMEVSISPQSSLGVRTRAKTLALQKLQQQQQQNQTYQEQWRNQPMRLRFKRWSFLCKHLRRATKHYTISCLDSQKT
ncbi:hypothetical protein ACFX15_032616 [Malus domestica]